MCLLCTGRVLQGFFQAGSIIVSQGTSRCQYVFMYVCMCPVPSVVLASGRLAVLLKTIMYMNQATHS